MREITHASARKSRKTGRKSPLATITLLALGLALTGGAYAAVNTSVAVADDAVSTNASQTTIDEGRKLYVANCATCHGLNAEGTGAGPTLIGVGAASVDFQVGTGRMPMAMQGPQAKVKPPQFTVKQTAEMAAYVASLAPGPGIPDAAMLDGKGDVAHGAELFRINCAMCHNVAGAGGALTQGKFAPPVVGIAPAHVYEAMVTGPQNMPIFNDLNLLPTDKRDIISYLNYMTDNPAPGGYELGSLGPVSEGLFLWIFGLGAIVALSVWITAKSN